MEEDLRDLLLADENVAAAVGDRVTWAERAQGGELPAVVLWLISQSRDHSIGGPSDLTRSRVQVDCWGSSYLAAKAAARAVAARLDGFAGVSGDTAFGGLFQEGARDFRDAPADELDRLFRVSLDFLVAHQPKD